MTLPGRRGAAGRTCSATRGRSAGAVLWLVIGLVFYLILFFIISYLVFGSLMMAVGAAVNDMREAQSLMTPIMILMHGRRN